MKQFLLLAAITMSLPVKSQNSLNVVPMPAEVKVFQKKFQISKSAIIINYTNDSLSGIYLRDAIHRVLNIYFPVFTMREKIFSMGKPRCPFILQLKKPVDNDTIIPESYTIDINFSEVKITAFDNAGITRGIQTLIQILENGDKITSIPDIFLSIPKLSIKDYPRFQYRGMHLDVCRHFMPVDLVKKYIDYLAMYKFNTFHWHLTEDQGWRIEIKKYPKLTEVGGWRNGTIVGSYPGKGNDSIRYGGFYTQEQIKDVVKYAADRYITIIPEIEMPGHSSAAIAAYPQLSCFPDEDTKYPAECVWAGPTKGKQVQQTWGVFEDVFCPSDYTFKFLEDVLDEVMPLFPSQYIHIGGDECPKDAWKRSPFCQQLMKEKGLKDEHELQSYFIQRMEKYINSKGKKIIGWDEILEGGLAPNATVMSWRGEAGGIAAAKQQHDVIMTPEYPLYLNHSQTKNEDSVTQGGFNPLDAVYNYEPIPKELTAEEGMYVLGAQGNVWSEYIDSKSKLEYSIFPRMAALAEVLWTPKEKRDWKDFERRLPVIFERLDKKKINYSKAYYELEGKVLPTADFNGVLWQLASKQKKANIIYATDMYDNRQDTYIKPIKINGSGLGYYASLIDNNSGETINSTKQIFHINKATGKKITLSTPADAKYPGDGAFTLVNGVQNTAGLSKSSEYLGFNGKDCEAIIDLGKTDSISKVTIHALNQNGDWIWRPSSVEIFSSDDGINFISLSTTNEYIKKENATGSMSVNFPSVKKRYVKVFIKNWGIISPGNSGSGNPAWLFVDEIEAE
jgi:hexosaminidase